MGREVRMVPPDWQHPKKEDGRYIPLLDRDFASEDAEWNEGYAKWQEGLCQNYSDEEKWSPIDPKYRHMRYTDYAGRRPSPDDYMPIWPKEQATHYMMYEDTSEGTPISPAFATPEELAQWLVGNNASSFAGMTASYESWLRVAKGGWAPSFVVENGVGTNGVDALTSPATEAIPITWEVNISSDFAGMFACLIPAPNGCWNWEVYKDDETIGRSEHVLYTTEKAKAAAEKFMIEHASPATEAPHA